MDFLLDLIFPPRERTLRARSLSVEGLVTLVQPICIPSVDPYAVSLLPYRNALVQATVTEAKFNDVHRAQQALGIILAEYLLNLASELPMVLLPVPLSRTRMKERGYNQVERICREALRHLHANESVTIRMDDSLLIRCRDTQPQTSLGGAARRQNLQNAFQTRHPPDPHTLYIVVDDVVTTGTTLSAVCEALHMARAQRILPVALAHSP